MDNQLNSSDKANVVIIGAGAGGLTTAAILSKAGLKVVVAEKQPMVGGYLVGFERQGFRFNSSIEWLSECGPNGFVSAIFNYIRDDVPECPQMTRLFRSKRGESDYVLTSKPLKMRDQLIRDYPEDEEGIRRFFTDAEKLADRLQELSRRIRSKETMTLVEKIRHGWGMTRLGLPIVKYVRTPVDKMLCKYFKSEAIRQIFCTQKEFMAVIVPFAWAFNGNYQKCPSGGSEVLARWLSDVVTSNGTDLRLSAEVTKVLVNEQKEACGIELADGRVVQAKYVVAACDSLMVYEEMLPSGTIPSKHLEALRDADLYDSYFSVFVGLDCPASELGFGEEALNLAKPGIAREQYTSGAPQKTLIVVLAPSERDPTLAPEGKGSISIHCPVNIAYGDSWKTGDGFERGDEYKAFKQKFADELLDRVESEYAPGLRDHIEMINVSTPVTYWRYTGNTQGTTSGMKPTNKNIRAGLARHRTPLKKLLLGGHCGEYGGGMPMAVRSGANAGLIILKELNQPGHLELAKVLSG